MLCGSRFYDSGWYVIKVDGFPRMQYLWYSKREALRRYREKFGLQHIKVKWFE